ARAPAPRRSRARTARRRAPTGARSARGRRAAAAWAPRLVAVTELASPPILARRGGRGNGKPRRGPLLAPAAAAAYASASCGRNQRLRSALARRPERPQAR